MFLTKSHVRETWYLSVMLSCLFLATLWSPAGRDWTLGSLVLYIVCVFVTFPYGVLGWVWYLVVLIPEL